jgi:hypothetical protein
MIVRKITNVSEFEVSVLLEGGNSVLLHTGQLLENVNVKNLNDIKMFVRVERDLSEVPVTEGRVYLKG